MRIGYFGTADFSANILAQLLNFSEIEVVFVVSQEDKKVGRKKERLETAVKQIAKKNKITVLQPQNLKENISIHEYSEDIDFFVVVAYGKIIPLDILEIPKYASINLHGSILPKYRGASPVQEAIKNGDSQTGLTSMYMSEGMDEGDMLLIEYIDIGEHDTQVDIYDKFESIGADLLYKTLDKISKKEITRIKQNEDEATYCKKIRKIDGLLDFKKNTGSTIYNKFRAYTPWPGVFCYYKGSKFDIISCSLGEKSLKGNPGEVVQFGKKEFGIITIDRVVLIIHNIKLEGKKAMNILDFVNGNPDFIGYTFHICLT